MKARTTILIPITLGLMISACSTSSRQQTDSVIGSEATSIEPQQQGSATNKDTELNETLQAKLSQIDSLKQQLADNQQRLLTLNQSLDEKDATIAELQKNATNAETLAALEEQKNLRQALESRYAALKLDNDLLNRRINQLENENTSLTQQVSRLEQAPTAEDNFQQRYFSLLRENTRLQQKYANLESDNQRNQRRLAALKKENLMLGGALSEARAQHQVLWDRIRHLSGEKVAQESDLSTHESPISEPQTVTDTESQEASFDVGAADYDTENSSMRMDIASLQEQVENQKYLIDEYRNDILKLEAALDETANYESRWQALDTKLAQAQQNNLLLSEQLSIAQTRLNSSQTELNTLSAKLSNTQQALEAKENNSISMAAVMASLESQFSARLQNVQWQLPNEMALHNTFEILVSATVQPASSGQTYLAELVTDSAIQMMSDPVVSVVAEDGRLQWRWRVSGLNERPEAQLNLFVSQQVNVQDQIIQRQIHRGEETLSLVNTNWLEKYGYWGVAILLGLLGGFLIGRVNKAKNNI
ncbi:hypothetical protein HGG82_01715 [Marinomonas sp. M1K-6]|uniref:Uncharacterized protein n=1 Tax=Marinomonas profundi TaxID=2726122 RepID=A0A847R7U2_9GAMM|nr:hypothetical protein [Marinomonas profundi]NLQ16340.1 hypothetical protein [Marinomonas profundi]UDV03085.1 hypothetical protein J8N69_16280 [Marinomonas profundi]